jgi:tetratricopeptide (TPR) repeat protein
MSVIKKTIRSFVSVLCVTGSFVCLVPTVFSAEAPDVVFLNKTVLDLSVANQALKSSAGICQEEKDLADIRLESCKGRLSKDIERFLKLETKVSGFAKSVVILQKENRYLTRHMQKIRIEDRQRTEKYERMVKDVTQEKNSNTAIVRDHAELLKMVRTWEEEKATLVRENERLVEKLNQLNLKNKETILTAQRMVGEKARSCLKTIPRQIRNIPRELKNLQDKNTALKLKNEQLQKLNAELEITSKQLYLKANSLKNGVTNCKGVSTALTKLNAEAIALKKNNDHLKSQLDHLKSTLDYERATIYREVGASYSTAELFEQAIIVYLDSLKLDPDDGPTHYYLGLLYSKTGDVGKALYYFGKYLNLSPQAENKEEVLYIMSLLEGRDDMVTK